MKRTMDLTEPRSRRRLNAAKLLLQQADKTYDAILSAEDAEAGAAWEAKIRRQHERLAQGLDGDTGKPMASLSTDRRTRKQVVEQENRALRERVERAKAALLAATMAKQHAATHGWSEAQRGRRSAPRQSSVAAEAEADGALERRQAMLAEMSDLTGKMGQCKTDMRRLRERGESLQIVLETLPRPRPAGPPRGGSAREKKP